MKGRAFLTKRVINKYIELEYKHWMHEYVDAYLHALLMFKCMPFKDLIFKLLLTLWIIKPAKVLTIWDTKVIPRELVSVGMDESHVCVLLKSFSGSFDTPFTPQGLRTSVLCHRQFQYIQFHIWIWTLNSIAAPISPSNWAQNCHFGKTLGTHIFYHTQILHWPQWHLIKLQSSTIVPRPDK